MLIDIPTRRGLKDCFSVKLLLSIADDKQGKSKRFIHVVKSLPQICTGQVENLMN